MDDIKTKADECLHAIDYARKNSNKQSNLSVLHQAEKLVLQIKQGDLEAKHELKGLCMIKPEISDPSTDIWLIEVIIGSNQSANSLQHYVDELIKAVEKKLYSENN